MSYRKLTLHTDRNLWDKQPNETPTAYARFLSFRDLRPSDRNYTRVAEISGKTVRTIEQQGSANRWYDRAAAWDAHQTAQRRQRLNEEEEEMGRAIMATARTATAVVLSSVRTISESGEPLPTKEVPRWVEAIDRLRRIALDRPEEITNVAAHTDAPTQDELANLTPEQRRARIREMSEHLVSAVND